MATNTQRAQAYADALLNRTATSAEVNRIGKAYASNAGRIAEYNAATNDVKAAILIDCARKITINAVKSTESSAAAQTAANNAILNVDADFEETT